MKDESWNTISIIGCLKNSLTLVLSILISIHHSAERFQRTFLSNEPLKPETSISNFKYQSIRIGKEIMIEEMGENIFNSMSPLFHRLSMLPRIVPTFTRASLSIALSTIEPRKQGERRFEWSTLVSRVLYSGASDYASQRLPRTTLQSRFPWRNSLLPWIVFVL